MKRCIVFFFYDKDGIVDRYIFHILQDLVQRSERIVFVCNGKLDAKGRRAVSEYTKDIMVRKNEGMDVWAYKEALSYLGWQEIYRYDELVLMNFTIFPTLHSFCEMFDDMERIDTDFWGTTTFFGRNTAVAGQVPDHIQSHFIAVRHPMLSSYEFKKYWEEMPSIQSYADSVRLHESRFTQRFEGYGFRSYAYAGAEELRPLTGCPAFWRQKYLLQNTKVPLIKRKTFFYPPYDGLVYETAGEAAVAPYDFLKKSGGYDTDMIWENILRTSPMTDIKNALQLNHIFPYEEQGQDRTGQDRTGQDRTGHYGRSICWCRPFRAFLRTHRTIRRVLERHTSRCRRTYLIAAGRCRIIREDVIPTAQSLGT